MSTDLEVRDDGMSVTLFGSNDPDAAMQMMKRVADTLVDVVRQQNLVVQIQKSEHLRVEAWTFLGALLGVFPVVVWTKPMVDNDGQQIGWEARVEARTRAGEVVGASEAECLRSERTWSSRDDYALRSMAQTRAVSKAMRGPLGFVVQLAGFNPTPAEEMVAPTVDMYDPDIPFGDAPQPQLQPPASAAQKKKLDVLVGKLRPEHVSTESLWKRAYREPVISDDGELHWSPLRDSLTKVEASKLIETLSTLEALSSSGVPNDRGSLVRTPGQADSAGHGESPAAAVPQAVSGEPATPDEISQLTARLVGASSKPQEAAYKIEMHAKDHTAEEHLAWLVVQEAKQFARVRGGDA